MRPPLLGLPPPLNPLLTACIELNQARRSKDEFAKVVPAFTADAPGTSPPAALAGMARAFIARIVNDAAGYQARLGAAERLSDEVHERVILALLALFVAKPGSLTGFAQLVPAVFDVHLTRDSALRLEMCAMLADMDAMDAALVERIATDDGASRSPISCDLSNSSHWRPMDRDALVQSS